MANKYVTHYVPLLSGGEPLVYNNTSGDINSWERFYVRPDWFSGDIYVGFEITGENTDDDKDASIYLVNSDPTIWVELTSVVIPFGQSVQSLRSPLVILGKNARLLLRIKHNGFLALNSVTITMAHLIIKQEYTPDDHFFSFIQFRDCSGQYTPVIQGSLLPIPYAKSWIQEGNSFVNYNDQELAYEYIYFLTYYNTFLDNTGEFHIGYASTPGASTPDGSINIKTGLPNGFFTQTDVFTPVDPSNKYHYLMYKGDGTHEVSFPTFMIGMAPKRGQYLEQYPDASAGAMFQTAALADTGHLIASPLNPNYPTQALVDLSSYTVDAGTGGLTRQGYASVEWQVGYPQKALQGPARTGYGTSYIVWLGGNSRHLYIVEMDASGNLTAHSFLTNVYCFCCDNTDYNVIHLSTTGGFYVYGINYSSHAPVYKHSSTSGGYAEGMCFNGTYSFVANNDGVFSFRYNGLTVSWKNQILNGIQCYSILCLTPYRLVVSTGEEYHILSVDGSGYFGDLGTYEWKGGEKKWLTYVDGYIHAANYTYEDSGVPDLDCVNTYYFDDVNDKLVHVGPAYSYNDGGVPLAYANGHCYGYQNRHLVRLPWPPTPGKDKRLKSYKSFRTITSKPVDSITPNTIDSDFRAKIQASDFSPALDTLSYVKWYLLVENPNAETITEALYNLTDSQQLSNSGVSGSAYQLYSSLPLSPASSEYAKDICPYYTNTDGNVQINAMLQVQDVYSYVPPAITDTAAFTSSLGLSTIFFGGRFIEVTLLSSLGCSGGVQGFGNIIRALASSISLTGFSSQKVGKYVTEMLSSLDLGSVIDRKYFMLASVLSNLGVNSVVARKAHYLLNESSGLDFVGGVFTKSSLLGILGSTLSVVSPMNSLRSRFFSLASSLDFSDHLALLRTLEVALVSSFTYDAAIGTKASYLAQLADSLDLSDDPSGNKVYQVLFEAQLLIASSFGIIEKLYNTVITGTEVRMSQAKAEVSLSSAMADVTFGVAKAEVTINFRRV